MTAKGSSKKGQPEETMRVIVAGRPDMERCDNVISTSKYTAISFFPVAIKEQFRRVANLYFLIIGIIMAIGYYTPAFDSAISPWTTLGPLAIVISFSLIQEGSADYGRHKSDEATNNFPCVVLRNANDLKEPVDLPRRKRHKREARTRDATVNKGENVSVDLRRAYFLPHRSKETPTKSKSSESVEIAFESVRRMNIRAGDLVLIRNRNMVPADIILLASSSENGSAYIETSSIDGETNLKLRTSPHLPKDVLQIIRNESSRDFFAESQDEPIITESLVQATRRIARISALAYPQGESVLENPSNPPPGEGEMMEKCQPSSFFRRISDKSGDMIKAAKSNAIEAFRSPEEECESIIEEQVRYIAALKSESPNASVNTYSGVLVMPPVEVGGPGVELPLNADNILLRGAVLRNTEWVIGLSCFTGTDTKLVQNSFETPSKFSQLDRLMNWTVILIICLMVIIITVLATLSTISTNQAFDELWYLSFNKDTSQPWPYLPGLEVPQWKPENQNWVQIFFLFVTLLTNFVPLSLYVTIECIVVAIRIFINIDLDMYDAVTNTRAVARSTTVTDLGQVQYVFSDKTGTLTQNVMRFKRCSVDGMIFGAPVEKSRPSAGQGNEQDDEGPTASFHPLRQLLVGKVESPKDKSSLLAGLEPLGGEGTTDTLAPSENLTFNAEMFLRVMSLCHTVVVEKDLDAVEGPVASEKKAVSTPKTSLLGSASNHIAKLFTRSLHESFENESSNPEEAVAEQDEAAEVPSSTGSFEKDGAPIGFAYQAESPDEGALVEAASCTFGFQVVGRDSSGIKLSCSSPSLLQDKRVIKGLKRGTLTPKVLAAETATESTATDSDGESHLAVEEKRVETWSILAVNKFDSDRKRMSILVRAPPELGSIPILFCKGADSSMLDKNICEDPDNVLSGREIDGMDIPKPTCLDRTRSEEEHMEVLLEGDEENENGANRTEEADNWESAAMLGIQAHLGTFAKEGLRTLVLGMRVLTEHQCEEWLQLYKSAATSIKDRSEKLTEAAKEIERHLHIVGATAIEDKLQRGVPETIAKLEQAGIKLWVLTGDKRETAIEIGYSTHVLTPKMHLTEVADNTTEHVRTLMAMEFIRLVKMGKLPDFQQSVLNRSENRPFQRFKFRLGKLHRRVWRSFRRFYWKYICFRLFRATDKLAVIDQEEKQEVLILQVAERRRNVRDRADKIIQDYLHSPRGVKQSERRKSLGAKSDSDDEISLTSDEVPTVFSRAQSARALLESRHREGKLAKSEQRTLSLAQLTAQQVLDGDHPLVDEDALSLRSFLPDDKNDLDFDRKKRTLLERMFAVDKAVRHGWLRKHARPEALHAVAEEDDDHARQEGGEHDPSVSRKMPRAFVIEGAALAHLLGDPELEELVFAVASCSDSVIACRVSPRQKALLVNLVRTYVVPEPITLAIGDGANDVGMIQEAHVGVGISGKEGQQAVNASDFAIAQFRFLEELLLIHGRWSFFRQTTVVLFSFYKNAVMAGCLIVFSRNVLYSGTPLFDEWLIAILNFVAGIPILFLGFFDRCLDKDYVRNNPEVYAPGRRNELITLRILCRWVILVFVHILTIFYMTVPSQSLGGGITPAFQGLMHNDNSEVPGDGEGGDLKSVGTVSYTCMIVLLGYKVLYESRSIIHGWWPAITCCRKNLAESGFLNRLAYSWVGVLILSYGFYLFAIYVYMLLGRGDPGMLHDFVDVTLHVLHTRSMSLMLIFMVPIMGMVLDVTGKVYSNMFYPTQTQIHVEIAAKRPDDDEPTGDNQNLQLSAQKRTSDSNV